MSDKYQLTKEEKRAINQLKRIEKTFPDSLWLFSASGTLCVMKKDEDNKRVYDSTGTVDRHYVVDCIDIENEGGDW